MKFDDGITQKLIAAKKQAVASQKPFAKKWSWFFVAMARKFSKAEAPTEDTIRAVAAQYGDRLKRRKGWSVEREIKKRIRMCGLMARRWYVSKIDTGRYSIRVWIANRVGYSKIQEDTHHFAANAAKFVGGKWNKDLKQSAKKVMDKFNG
jgi:hypothetical protein